VSRNQGSGPARQVANAWRPLKNNRGAANDVLANQSRRATGDVLRQSKQRLAENRGDQNDRESIDFLSVLLGCQWFSSLVERCGSMLLRRRPLVQVLETQDRQQYNESEGVRGDVESELNQTVHRDAGDPDD
jgi:hypothetical protein